MSYVAGRALEEWDGARCAEHRRPDRLFRIFHGFSPDQLFRVRHPRLVPRVLVNLGRLRGVIYASDRGRRGTPRTFIHFMQSCPRLACDPEGRQLYIVGGRYRVSSRGLEG